MASSAEGSASDEADASAASQDHGSASDEADASAASQDHGSASDEADASAGEAAASQDHDSAVAVDADEVTDEPDPLAHAIAERDALRDMLQRVQADFINYRKRTTAQSAADIERATGRLVEALLPVLDAAEAAYIRHPDEVGPLLNSMLTELRRHGLETLDLDGKPFDPEVADAVAHEAGDDSGRGGIVVDEVLRSGYRWKGTTLRPAMVRTRG